MSQSSIMAVLLSKYTDNRDNNFNLIRFIAASLVLYAFPVQQSIAALIPNVSVTTMVIVSFGVTFVLAFISWHLVEKKCLKMKGNYVVFESMLKNIRKKHA